MKALKTEYNDEENDNKNNRKYFYKGLQTTNHYKSQSTSLDIFLDYAFRQKKTLISKEKNKVKLLNYSFELEQTVSLNLQLLLSYFNSSNSNNKKKIVIMNDNKSRDTAESSSSITSPSLIQLIKIIIEKAKRKAETNKKINNLITRINNKIDDNKKYYLKIKEQKFKYKQKINKSNNNLDNMDNYIISMNKKFYKIQKHIDSIIVNKNNKILYKNNNIFDFIVMNISYNKKINNLKNDLKLYYCLLSEVKIDNDLYIEEKKLYNDKRNINLIRCMEFYRRTNFNLYAKLKILRKKYKKIVEIMDILNLSNIVQFSIQKNEEVPNFEIEFSKINKEDNNLELFPKMHRNINSSLNLDV